MDAKQFQKVKTLLNLGMNAIRFISVQLLEVICTRLIIHRSCNLRKLQFIELGKDLCKTSLQYNL